MGARVLIPLSVILLLGVCVTEQAYFLGEDFIETINEKAKTWKAGINFDPKTPKEYIIKLLGSKGVQAPHKLNLKMYKSDDDESYVNLFGRIPRTFDARRRWRRCITIGQVRDQGNCGSCWALATSSAFADRLCIATKGEFNELLSAEELTFCCHLCGFGCRGGYPIMAWSYFRRHGIVTGGDYRSEEGCAPYRIAPCIDEYGNSTCKDERMERNHRCTRMCYGDQEIDYHDDHRFTKDYYYLTYGIIQKEVMTYGPIEASMDVYDDFPSYKSGVYEKSKNATYLGGHAVKLIGWGEEYGVPYWLMVNSWSNNWGDNGLFKIRRGTNECNIDNSTTAGIPVVN